MCHFLLSCVCKNKLIRALTFEIEYIIEKKDSREKEVFLIFLFHFSLLLRSKTTTNNYIQKEQIIKPLRTHNTHGEIFQEFRSKYVSSLYICVYTY